MFINTGPVLNNTLMEVF